MRFGGHETFFLRPGWITKGLMLAQGAHDLTWNSDAASDAMGVGRNMSKSIGWWLARTGLVHRPARGEELVLTSFGRAVLAQDRYLTQPATLWLLHLHLTLRGEDDMISWFFRQNQDRRFTRDALEGALRGYLEGVGEDAPAPKTLHRDVAVLLQSYAHPIPPRAVDPEDNLDCPLRRLGLLVHRVDLDVFERRDTTTLVPPEVVASALCSFRPDSSRKVLEIGLDDLGALRMIGRVLGRDHSSMSDLIAEAAAVLDNDLLQVRNLAGQRVVRVRNLEPADWLACHVARTSTPTAALA